MVFTTRDRALSLGLGKSAFESLGSLQNFVQMVTTNNVEVREVEWRWSFLALLDLVGCRFGRASERFDVTSSAAEASAQQTGTLRWFCGIGGLVGV
jgi:hypothetical protein